MLKRIVVVVIVVFINVQCAKYRHIDLPINLKSISGFTEEEESLIYEWLEEINKYTNSTLIDFNGSNSNSSLSIIKSNYIPKLATKVAGRATIEYQKCTIEILSLVTSDNDLFKTILWHEFGHCVGLEHDPRKGEIMYKEAIPFSNLSEKAIENFFNQIISIIK